MPSNFAWKSCLIDSISLLVFLFRVVAGLDLRRVVLQRHVDVGRLRSEDLGKRAERDRRVDAIQVGDEQENNHLFLLFCKWANPGQQP